MSNALNQTFAVGDRVLCIATVTHFPDWSVASSRTFEVRATHEVPLRERKLIGHHQWLDIDRAPWDGYHSTRLGISAALFLRCDPRGKYDFLNEFGAIEWPRLCGLGDLT